MIKSFVYRDFYRDFLWTVLPLARKLMKAAEIRGFRLTGMAWNSSYRGFWYRHAQVRILPPQPVESSSFCLFFSDLRHYCGKRALGPASLNKPGLDASFIAIFIVIFI